MKMFEQQQTGGRVGNSCGYCREKGHNRTECPHVVEDWKYWSKFEVPPRKQGWYRSRNHPKYWGEWYTDCMNTMIKQEAKQKKQMNPTPVVRSAPKCGFCGEEGHNRRNCPRMTAFIELCKQANINYRRSFHEEFVKNHGIDIGAAVEIVQTSGWSTEVENTHIGLISSINLESINVFTALDSDYDSNEKYGQEISVRVLIDGSENTVNISPYCQRHPHLEDKVKRFRDRWSRLKLSKVIGKSEAPLPDDWVTSYSEAWTFLTKKRSYAQLEEAGIVSHINFWANRT